MNKTMTRITTEPRLHVSYSQVWSYLNCSLRYYFNYVLGLPRERTSISIMFGSAFHKALERYYTDIMLGKAPTPLPVLQDLFAEHLTAQIAGCRIPILYKKDMATEKDALEMGRIMLEATYGSLAPGDSTIVAGVEVPLFAQLTDPEGNAIDMTLTGIVDLILLDASYLQPIVVDFKTSKQSRSQTDADDDLQMSVYSHLLVENGYITPESSLECRFAVFRKLKAPRLETVTTYREEAHRARLLKIISAVLSGIDSQVFIPNKGWLCSDCAYADACRAW